MRSALLLVMLSLPCLCSAMSVDSYKSMKADAESASSGAASADLGLKSYLAGVAETLTDQRSANGFIVFENKPLVCMPAGVDISVSLLRITIDAELGKNADIYSKDLGPDWTKYSVAVIAKAGLARMFPCPAVPEAPVKAAPAATTLAPAVARPVPRQIFP